MKTSYYSQAAFLDWRKYYLVAISVTQPDWIEVDNMIHVLMPGSKWLWDLKKGRISFGKYSELYLDQCNTYLETIKERIDEVKEEAGDREVVLLCWEKDRTQCHRQLFANWWESITGEKVDELNVKSESL